MCIEKEAELNAVHKMNRYTKKNLGMYWYMQARFRPKNYFNNHELLYLSIHNGDTIIPFHSYMLVARSACRRR